MHAASSVSHSIMDRASARRLIRSYTSPSESESERRIMKSEDAKREVIKMLEELYTSQNQMLKSLEEYPNGDPSIEDLPITLIRQQNAVDGVLDLMFKQLKDAEERNNTLSGFVQSQHEAGLLLDKDNMKNEEEIKELKAEKIQLQQMVEKMPNKKAEEKIEALKAEKVQLQQMIQKMADKDRKDDSAKKVQRWVLGSVVLGVVVAALFASIKSH